MDSKQIRVSGKDHKYIQEYANKLAQELNMNVTLPDAIKYAIKRVQEAQK